MAPVLLPHERNITWLFDWDIGFQFGRLILPLYYWIMILDTSINGNLFVGFQVGMSIDPKLLISNFPVIMGTLGLLIGGKALLVALVGKLFGISIISAIRVGLLLAPGGEFAFVAFGEAVNQVFLSVNLILCSWDLLVNIIVYTTLSTFWKSLL